MSKTSADLRRAIKEREPWVVRRFLESAVMEGTLQPTAPTYDAFAAAADAYLDREARRRKHLVKQDHESFFLERARSARRQRELPLATVLYALWCEHWANRCTAALALRRGVREDAVPQLLRDVPFSAKLSWLPEALGATRPSTRHCAVLTELMNRRNAFIHYKWKATDIDDWGEDWGEVRSDPALTRLLGRIEGTIAYLRRWEVRTLLGENRKFIHRFVTEA